MPPAFVLSQDQTLRKNYFHHSLYSSWSFFAKKICDSSDSVQLYKFIVFTTTFQVLFKTFKIWLGLIARFNFSRNTQIKIKNTSPTKTHLFSSGLPLSSALFSTARCVSAICYFRPIFNSDFLFANSCRSWCCLMYHQSRICQTHFSKKFNFFLKFFMHPAWSKHKISLNDIEFKTSYICINKLLFKTPFLKNRT